jgi:4-amino-4-deoxy-L-arabinose transferase-like glycosyltransferase
MLAGAAVLLRLPALFAARHLTFDDGVYGASAVAMRDGGVPFREVFSSQGPLFLPLVWLADVVGLRTLDAPRLLGVSSGVVVTLAVYLLARELTDRWGALLAAGLATVSGSMLWVTGPIASDGPALAASAMALCLAVRYRRNPSVRLALGVGVAVGIALAAKLTALPVLVPVGWVLLQDAILPRTRDRSGLVRLALSGSSAAVVFLVPAVAFGFADVWDQSVAYHSEATGGRDVLGNISKVASTFADRDLVLLLFAVGAAVWFASQRRGGEGEPAGRSGDVVLVWSWLGATVLLLLYIHPLWRPHVSGLVAPVALLVGCYRPPAKIVLVAAALLAPLAVWRVDNYLRPGDYSGAAQALQADLDELPDGAWALSDEPGLVWRAGRRTTDDLVDASILRIESGRLTAESLADAAGDRQVCAVAVWSGVRWGSFGDLPALLADEGYRVGATYGGPRVLYVRDACEP